MSCPFQAVIMAGGIGTQLMPLTDSLPKCMLPIANVPLVHYQLELLEKAGFFEAIVVMQRSQLATIGRYVNDLYKGNVNIQLEVVDGYMGTADVLRIIKDRLTRDFLVVSGDLVTDAPIQLLADIQRITNSAVSVLVAPTPAEPVVEVSKKKKNEKDKEKDKMEDLSVDQYFVGLAPGIESLAKRLVAFNAAGDCETVRLSKNLLERFPRINLYHSLRDAHVYLFNHWVLDLLIAKPEIDSIQGDLIPYLVKHQFDGVPFPVELPPAHLSSADALSSAARSSDKIACYALIVQPDFFCQRVTTIPQFVKTSRKVASGEVPLYSPIVHNFLNSASVGQSCFIGRDCIVGQGFRIDRDSAVSNSIVGSHVVIGSHCKISNCIIMDHVTIENQCVLEDTIVCSNANFHEKCKLSSCNVAMGVDVSGTHKNENLQNENVL